MLDKAIILLPAILPWVSVRKARLIISRSAFLHWVPILEDRLFVLMSATLLLVYDDNICDYISGVGYVI